MNIKKWDTENYTSKFDFVPGYGEAVLDLLDIPEGGYVVDVGSGTGQLTEKIKERGFNVIGIDSSADMLAAAEKLHPDIEFRKDNAVTFKLENKADAVFSSSVLHWIDRAQQLDMASNFLYNLKPGGIFVCEFGGKDCCEIVRGTEADVFSEYGLVYPRFFYFPTIGEYAQLLERAGFIVEYAAFFKRPTPLKAGDTVSDWILEFEKNAYEGVDENTKKRIIVAVEKITRPFLYTKDKGWVIDYVRIRIKARKP